MQNKFKYILTLSRHISYSLTSIIWKEKEWEILCEHIKTLSLWGWMSMGTSCPERFTILEDLQSSLWYMAVLQCYFFIKNILHIRQYRSVSIWYMTMQILKSSEKKKLVYFILPIKASDFFFSFAFSEVS